MIIKFKRVAPANIDGYNSLILGELAVSLNYFATNKSALFIGDGSGAKTLLNPAVYTKTESDNLFTLAADNTIARLAADDKVDMAHMPDGEYIDLEFHVNKAAFPGHGLSGVIYFAADTGKEYIWVDWDREQDAGDYIEINEWMEEVIDGGEV